MKTCSKEVIIYVPAFRYVSLSCAAVVMSRMPTRRSNWKDRLVECGSWEGSLSGELDGLIFGLYSCIFCSNLALDWFAAVSRSSSVLCRSWIFAMDSEGIEMSNLKSVFRNLFRSSSQNFFRAAISRYNISKRSVCFASGARIHLLGASCLPSWWRSWKIHPAQESPEIATPQAPWYYKDCIGVLLWHRSHHSLFAL